MKRQLIKSSFVLLALTGLFLVAQNKADAAWQYRTGSSTFSTGTGNLTVNKPTGTVQGDLIIVIQTSALSTSTPGAVDSGWTQISTGGQVTGCCQVYAYYRIAGSSEPATYSFSFANNGTSPSGVAIATFYNDAGGGIALDTASATDFTTQVTTHTAPSITTSTTDTLVIGLYSADGTAGVNRSFTTAVLTERVDQPTNGGVGTMIASTTQAGAGATGTKDATVAGADRGRAFLVAFKRIPPPQIWFASPQSPFSYQLGGYYDPSGVQSYGYFRYGTSSPGSTCSDSYGTRYPSSSASDSNLGSGSGTQYYTGLPTGLSANTTYYWCAMVRDSSGSSVVSSSYSTFTTDPATPATVSLDATSVFTTTASLNGTSNPRTTSTTGWFRYWTSNPGSCSDSGGTRFPSSGGSSIGTGNSATFYKQQATGLTPGQQYWYCAISSNAYGTTIGTLKTFTMASTMGTSCSLMPGSTLIDGNDESFLQTYLSNYQGTLVYRATTNGWTAANFHSAANGQGPTLTIIKSTANQVFGGYNSMSWDSSSGYMPGDESFLFNLTNNYRLTATSYLSQTYNNSSYGPTFGGGHDIGMVSGGLNAIGVHYTNTSTYQNPNTQGAYTYLDGGGGSPSAYNFNASNVEVYKLTVCPPSVPVIGSPTQTNKTYNSITLGGNITNQGGSAVDVRGVCYSETTTNASPQHGGTGVTCTNDVSGGTGIFTVNVSGLSPSTGYSYKAFGHNTQGYGYTSADTFTTDSNLPTGTDTSAAASVNSFYATLRGAANPNGFQTYGHFRVFPTNPGNCNSDSGGNRYPENAGPSYDINLGSGTTLITHLTNPSFQFTIPFTAGAYLVPNTTYWYCAYAVGTNGTGGASSVQSFTTPDGQASPCDPPTTGNLTVPAGGACSFDGSYGGVDAGSGTQNSGVLTIAAGASLTVNTGQQIAFGSLVPNQGAEVVMQQGASLVGGGAYVADADSDGYIDNQTQYVGSSPPGGYRRRNLLATNYNYAWKIASGSALIDCNSSNQYVYRNIAALVTDADNDGYKTSAASNTQCVGTQSTINGINGRTYFKNTSNIFGYLPDAQKLSASTDCQDNPSGQPCAPTNGSGTNGTDPTAAAASTTQINLSWGVNSIGGAVPAVTGYDVQICGLNDTTCASYSTQSVSSATYSYGDSGIACSTSPSYYYRIVAKHTTNGNTNSNIFSGITSTCCTNGYKDYDGDGYGAGSNSCWAPSASYSVVGTGTDCYDYDGANSTTRTQSSYARPGQTSYFTLKRGAPSNVNDWAGNSWNSWDYNCDGNYTNTLTNTTTAPGSMPTRTYCSGTGPTNIYNGYTYCSNPCDPYCCGTSNACDPHRYCSSYTTAQIVCGNTYTLFSSGPSYTTYYYANFCSGGNNQNISGYYEAAAGSNTVSCR